MRYIGFFFLAIALYAQPDPDPLLRWEAFASLGVGRPFRIEDRSFGNHRNFGGGFGLRHRSGLGLEFDLNRTGGLTPEAVPCAILDVTCVGTGRQGLFDVTVGSANVLYHFSRSRVQPYVTGGAGALWARGVSTSIFVRGSQAELVEQEFRDSGLAVNFGAGIRFLLHRSVSIRSEFRLYSASALSRQNLSLLRASIGAGFHF